MLRSLRTIVCAASMFLPAALLAQHAIAPVTAPTFVRAQISGLAFPVVAKVEGLPACREGERSPVLRHSAPAAGRAVHGGTVTLIMAQAGTQASQWTQWLQQAQHDTLPHVMVLTYLKADGTPERQCTLSGVHPTGFETDPLDASTSKVPEIRLTFSYSDLRLE